MTDPSALVLPQVPGTREQRPVPAGRRFVRPFGEIGLVGGKNASLGEMYRRLTSRGVRVPDGFALTAEGYRCLLDESDRRVREEMGLANLKLMIPFCRRVDEAVRVLAAMEKHGLSRGRDGLEIYVMCEIPNNVIQIDAFARLFDGFSIGSNDLTQLVLGVDRDSEIVAFDFDERDEGVKTMIRMAVEGAKRNHRHSGICGQAPSDYPEFAQFLVRLGIDSISVDPDVLLKTRELVAGVEAELRS